MFPSVLYQIRGRDMTKEERAAICRAEPPLIFLADVGVNVGVNVGVKSD